MTVLSDNEILEYMKRRELHISPFAASCLNPAGYDLRSSSDLTIRPGQHQLLASVERVELGLELTASLHIRSSLAREGVIGSFAAVDPGFRGQLTLTLHNSGERVVDVRKGEPVVQMVFHRLGTAATTGYAGKYQESNGVVNSKRK